MLVLLILVTIAGALAVEWMIHHLISNYEVEWRPPAPVPMRVPTLLRPRHPVPPLTPQEYEQQMNEAFKQHSDESWLK